MSIDSKFVELTADVSKNICIKRDHLLIVGRVAPKSGLWIHTLRAYGSGDGGRDMTPNSDDGAESGGADQ